MAGPTLGRAYQEKSLFFFLWQKFWEVAAQKVALFVDFLAWKLRDRGSTRGVLSLLCPSHLASKLVPVPRGTARAQEGSEPR